ncbi:hypothetical protein NLI96_g3020 [Meripilus lineatus]|uniref:FAD-binding domain-containing protein n=1 Tax=Meripilus lineatus TaxID=2056292 RepID=A0AAD5V9P4_9APHY|nr:hypothetical protein NLI96_g3020 [Physisporinus lineatus]
MTSTAPKDFSVAIIGGGVCGLTCAIALSQRGVHVEIFEAASKFGEIGAGLGLGPNSLRILKELGVFEDVYEKSGENILNMYAYRYISGMDGHEVLYEYPVEPADRGLGIARSAFLDALVKHIDPATAHFKKRCINITPSQNNPARSTIQFADGTTHEADVVIGADGVKSNVRNTVVSNRPGPFATFSNTLAYRALVPYDKAKNAGLKTDLSKGMVCFVGKDKHIIAYLIRGGEVINLVGFVTVGPVPEGGSLPSGHTWVEQAPEEKLVKHFEGWGYDAVTIMSHVREPSKWSIHVVHPAIDSYVNGRIALIGDAAHAMFTHLGAGAGQGLEDGLVLARLLTHPQSRASNLEGILKVYDELRRPRAQHVWESSLQTGEVYEGRGRLGISPAGISQELKGVYDFVWHHNLQEDIDSGIHLLLARKGRVQ